MSLHLSRTARPATTIIDEWANLVCICQTEEQAVGLVELEAERDRLIGNSAAVLSMVDSIRAERDMWMDAHTESVNCFKANAVENALLRKALADAKTAWGELYNQISDDQGFIYDAETADCVTCGQKAASIGAIVHDESCLTAAVQAVCAALEVNL